MWDKFINKLMDSDFEYHLKNKKERLVKMYIRFQ